MVTRWSSEVGLLTMYKLNTQDGQILASLLFLWFPKAVPGMTYGVNEPHWAAVSALGMMVVIPIVMLSFYMQKYIVRGMSYGAIRE